MSYDCLTKEVHKNLEKDFGKKDSQRRFRFVSESLKLSGFPDEGTIPGWELTAQLPPPVVSRIYLNHTTN